MATGKNQPFEAGRSHIIKRPRLTRLLDEATARIVMLVAPAGYGKTTLAREWLAGQPHGWYRGSQAAADVAALAVGLARAASTIVPNAGARMEDRLRATGTPDVEPLAELLAEDLEGWPDDAWVAFDDYQFASESTVAEYFVDLLLGLCPLRLLVATRTRPSWATSRRLLYGEIYEIGRSLLAMSQDEASQVLANRPGSEAQGLVALADGWPAVIGLAALTGDLKLPDGSLPESLYMYFAEELYQAADPHVQEGLTRLALASTLPPGLAESILGEGAELVVSEGLRLGFLTSSTPGTYEIHPLVRGFLEEKFSERGAHTASAVVSPLVRTLAQRQAWDDAFSLVNRFFDATLFVDLLEAALPQLLREARLPTLARWLEGGRENSIDSPVADLAEAELAFRDGDRDRAEALALQAARRFGTEHLQTARAFCLAGSSAHLDYRDDTALEHFARARKAAQTESDQRQALWGQFAVVAGLERDDAAAILSELEASSTHSADDLFRLGNGQLVLAHLKGNVNVALDAVRPLVPLAERTKDPLIRSSFLNVYASSLILAARYSEGLEIADSELEQAHQFRLAFVLPHACVYRAAALLGLRRFKPCGAALDHAERARRRNDGFLIMNIGAVRARLQLALGSIDEALETFETHHHRLSLVGMEGEFLACWSLALACRGRSREAERKARQAEATTQRAEVAALVPWTRAVTALRIGARDTRSIAQQALETATRIGNLDSLVTAYRAFPPVLDSLAGNVENRKILVATLEQSRDHALARRVGLRIPATTTRQGRDGLSRREQEVFDLLVRGMPNKEIARALYITEGTVKTHLHHIYEKLGVRSRTEAVLSHVDGDKP